MTNYVNLRQKLKFKKNTKVVIEWITHFGGGIFTHEIKITNSSYFSSDYISKCGRNFKQDKFKSTAFASCIYYFKF